MFISEEKGNDCLNIVLILFVKLVENVIHIEIEFKSLKFIFLEVKSIQKINSLFPLKFLFF